MSNMKNYRAIGVTDENGSTIAVMNVHVSVSDETVMRLIRRYQYEVVRRIIEEKIEKNGEGEGEADTIHVVHRLNLLKKLVRMNGDMNGFVTEYRHIVRGNVFDCKDFKKRNVVVVQREFEKMQGDNAERVIETQEEIAFYNVYGHTYMEPVKMEKVYITDVSRSEDGLKKVCLYSEMENI